MSSDDALSCRAPPGAFSSFLVTPGALTPSKRYQKIRLWPMHDMREQPLYSWEVRITAPQSQSQDVNLTFSISSGSRTPKYPEDFASLSLLPPNPSASPLSLSIENFKFLRYRRNVAVPSFRSPLLSKDIQGGLLQDSQFFLLHFPFSNENCSDGDAFDPFLYNFPKKTTSGDSFSSCVKKNGFFPPSPISEGPL